MVIKNKNYFLLTILFILIIFSIFIFNKKDILLGPEPLVSKTYNFNVPEITFNGNYHLIKSLDLDYFEISGSPVIPFKTVSFVIPPGEKIEKILVSSDDLVSLGEEYTIIPGRESLPQNYQPNFIDNNSIYINGDFDEFGNPYELSEQIYKSEPNISIYNSSLLYPGNTYSIESIQEKYGYNILTIRLFPIQYSPRNKELFYYPSLEVQLYTSSFSDISISSYENKKNNLRGLNKDISRISDIVDNPEAISQKSNIGISQLENSENYEYIIITSNVLETEFQKLIDWKNLRGINSKLFFTEDILSNPIYFCSGEWGDGCGVQGENRLDDSAARIRNFIKYAYKSLGVDYVLLGGDISIIPQRGIYIWTGGQLTNFSVPSDLYYAGLNGSWNNDRDELFGEKSQPTGPEVGCAPLLWRNGTKGDEFDLFAEVYIGRAPVENLNEAKNFVDKTIAYENSTINNEDYLNRALVIAERLDMVTDSSESIEFLIKNLSQFDIEKIYEIYWEDIKHPNSTHTSGSTGEVPLLLEPTSKYFNEGVSLVIHSGHANEDSVMRFDPREILAWNSSEYSLYIRDRYPLNNTIYPLIYSIGCNSAAFDRNVHVWSNSFKDNIVIDSMGENFVISPNGAFAYIGNTRYGFYRIESVDGPSDIFQRSFFEQINLGNNNIGKALQKSREMHYSIINDEYQNFWVYLNLVLLGDPETPLKSEFNQPKIIINSPNYRTQINSSLDINATIEIGDLEGSSFSNFSVEYGYGLYPSKWLDNGIKLIQPTNQKSSEKIAEIDTTYLQDGPVKFRVSAYNNEGKSSHSSIMFFSDNIKIDYPFIWSSDSILFNGLANISNFSNFSFSYKKENSNFWNTVYESSFPVIDNSLGSIPVSALSPGEYYVNLKVYSKNGILNEENSSFVFDPQYLPGWPQYADNFFISYSAGVGQLSNSPGMEIVAGDSQQGAKIINVYAWYSNGTPIPGWPVSFDKISRSMGYSSSPLLTDLNGDGIDEVFISVAGKIYGIYANGSFIPGWVGGKPGGGFRTLSLINIDEQKALVSVPCGDGVYVYYLNGSLVNAWPISVSEDRDSPWLQTPTIGDFDDDGSEDIIIISSLFKKIYAYHSNGSIFKNWPISVPLCAESIYPVMGDIDADGKKEIIFGTGDGFFLGANIDSNYKCNRGYIYAYHSNGELVNGWPIKPEDYLDFENLGYSGGISIGNLDEDPELELVVNGIASCTNKRIYLGKETCINDYGAVIFDYNNSKGRFTNTILLPNRNYSYYVNKDSYGTGIHFLSSPAIIADITGDGIQEILFSAREYDYKQTIHFINDTGNKLYAIHINGSFANGWPKKLPQLLGSEYSGRSKFSSPVISDLNEDGVMDIIFADEKHLIVWNLSTPYNYKEELLEEIYLSPQDKIIGKSDWPTAFGSYSYNSFFNDYFSCSEHSDCNDNRDCSIDSCISGKCIYNFSDCQGCLINSDCNDNRDCSIDSCISGKCIYNNSACDKVPNTEQVTSSGGSSSSTNKNICIPNWSCNWSDCINGFKTYECSDLKSCNNISSRPFEPPIQCSDSWIPEVPEDNKELDSKFNSNYLFILIVVLFILVLIYFLIRFIKPFNDFFIKKEISNLRSRGYRDDIIVQILIEKGNSPDKIKSLL